MFIMKVMGTPAFLLVYLSVIGDRKNQMILWMHESDLTDMIICQK